MITYYEFMYRNLTGMLMHPEVKKRIELVHYKVEHNLPVKRQLLYEVVPELFEDDIKKLPQEDQL
jgi:hypothetical protein